MSWARSRSTSTTLRYIVYPDLVGFRSALFCYLINICGVSVANDEKSGALRSIMHTSNAVSIAQRHTGNVPSSCLMLSICWTTRFPLASSLETQGVAAGAAKTCATRDVRAKKARQVGSIQADVEMRGAAHFIRVARAVARR